MNSAEQSPSGAAKNCSGSQETPHISWNPKVYHQAYEAIAIYIQSPRSYSSI
jgi:hypothetical protein